MSFGDPQNFRYDLAVVGTGFASSFFLHEYLRKASSSARIVVLERGARWNHAERVERRANSAIEPASLFRSAGAASKPWTFTVAFGGGTNCWWGNTPRLLPADFEMQSRFGVGRDWPIGYDELAPYYDLAERIMSISGPTKAPYPRTSPCPQPPHRLNRVEELLKRQHPEHFFATPTARARVAIEGRGTCCANGVCHLCPVDAKFTVENSMMAVYDDPRVTVVLDAEVQAIETAAGMVSALAFTRNGRSATVSADLIMLGANALFNPAILKRSGIQQKALGPGLHEQIGVRAEIFLDGVDSFGGSSSVTGLGYWLYADETRRREMAACMIETWNVGLLRREPGRRRQVLPVRLVYEDLPSDINRVIVDPNEPDRPIAVFEHHSSYTQRAIDQAAQDLERVFGTLPVESIELRGAPEPTEAHILGTTPMGTDPDTSVVDSNGKHHTLRNLIVLGSGNFPTGSPANPSLTIAALALRAARQL